MDVWRGEATIPGAEADGPECLDEGAMNEHGGSLCTREPGHPGRHLAGATGDIVIAAWPGTHPPTLADLAG